MILRPGSPADIGPMEHLWNTHFGASLRVRTGVLRMTVFDDPTRREGDVVVAVEGDAIRGVGWLKRWRPPWADRRFADVAFLGGLVVADAGQGVGSRLLRALEDQAHQEGCTSMEISGGLLHLVPGVPAEAVDALRFFEHNGYAFEADRHYDLIGRPSRDRRGDRAGDRLLSCRAWLWLAPAARPCSRLRRLCSAYRSRFSCSVSAPAADLASARCPRSSA